MAVRSGEHRKLVGLVDFSDNLLVAWRRPRAGNLRLCGIRQHGAGRFGPNILGIPPGRLASNLARDTC